MFAGQSNAQLYLQASLIVVQCRNYYHNTNISCAIPCYHQIRANNEYVASNWSEPYLILLVSDGSKPCNFEVSMDTEWISNILFTIPEITVAEYGEEPSMGSITINGY